MMRKGNRILVAVLLIMGVCSSGLTVVAASPARPPRFSHEGGFYPSEFNLVLSPPAPGGTIYYTLDGSEPTTESTVYSTPIPIVFTPNHDGGIAHVKTTVGRVPTDMQWRPPATEPMKATVVRAWYVLHGADPSPVVTHTYFTSPNIRSRFTMPVISITTDPAGFFSYETGMYVPGKIYDDADSDLFPYGTHPANYNQHGSEWERSAHMTWFDPDGSLGFEQDIGIRMHGAWSRSQPMKSMRIYARTVYGEGNIIFSFFSQGRMQTYERLLLRNGGQDFYYSFMRDVFGHSLMSHLDLDVQDARSCVVFINGVYWGIHYIRERYDERYIEKYYGIDPSQVVLMENNSELLAGTPEDILLWNTLRDYLFENSLESDDAYQHVLDQIDLENYLDYLLLSMYSGNRDWPGNNVRFWRVRDPVQTGTLTENADGRWRWLINDLDVAFMEAYHNMYTMLMSESTAYPTPAWSTIMFKRLMENEEFRIRYLSRLDYHLNTTFSPEHGLFWVDTWQGILQPEMGHHIQRWRRPESVDDWESYVEELRTFVRKRPYYLRIQTEEFFELEESRQLTVLFQKNQGGVVHINGIPLAGADSEWTGYFFADTSLQLEAVPGTGYTFTGWETATGEVLSGVDLVLTEDMTLRPLFERQIWAQTPVLILSAIVLAAGLAGWLVKIQKRRKEMAFSHMLLPNDEDENQ